jgi:SAM-dependent methyltransferase
MNNPWRHIPASDYEAHMSSPQVAQLEFLAHTFRQALQQHNSRQVGLLGCATGNGLEYIDKARTDRVTVVDINPEYLDILRERYAGRVSSLDIVQADLETCELATAPFTLIFAGLIFEYVHPVVLLTKIYDWLHPDGVMVSVLQLASKTIPAISATPYKSLQALDRIQKLHDPIEFQTMAAAAGFQQQQAHIVTLASGKSFYVGTFIKHASRNLVQ